MKLRNLVNILLDLLRTFISVFPLLIVGYTHLIFSFQSTEEWICKCNSMKKHRIKNFSSQLTEKLSVWCTHFFTYTKGGKGYSFWWDILWSMQFKISPCSLEHNTDTQVSHCIPTYQHQKQVATVQWQCKIGATIQLKSALKCEGKIKFKKLKCDRLLAR